MHKPAHSVDIYSPLDYYAMNSGDILTLRRRHGGVIRCLQGRVLVSLQGCPTDYDLSPGMSMAIDRNPLVLIESYSEGRIAIEFSEKPRRAFWPMIGLLLLIGLAMVPAGEQASAAARISSTTLCTPDVLEARLAYWRAGKGLLDTDGMVATNGVLSGYERQFAGLECAHE